MSKCRDVEMPKRQNVRLYKCQNVNLFDLFWIDCQVNVYPTRGSLVGRVGRARVVRGSLISTPVREIRGSRGDPPLNIYYYYSAEGRSATRDPSKNNIVLGVYRGKGGFTKVVAAEKLSGRESGISGLSPPTQKAFGKTMATTNTGKHYKTTTTDEDERRVQTTNERRLYV